jgi:holo-[acyl-carrier protein] synthase
MPLSAGIDVIDVCEIEESIRRFGEQYLRRFFTPGEIAACSSRGSATRLAACFAAKEAAMKALAVSEEAINWRSIEIRGLSSDRPALALSGRAAEIAEREGVLGVAVSVRASRRYAAAVVIIDKCGKDTSAAPA